MTSRIQKYLPDLLRRDKAVQRYSLDPFQRMHQEMDRLFDAFFQNPWQPLAWSATDSSNPYRSGDFLPQLELVEKEDAYVVTAELPGMNLDDLKLDYQDGVLELSGEKKEEESGKQDGIRYSERAFGAFTRAVKLPAEIDPDKVDASFKDGILTVRLPKAEPKEPKHTIQIRQV